ncbi:MAG: D-alanyl-D-alanine carboxypeptidase [Clostridia bacterium]|nr:D-alanyl-D-alanine carboxypeptidase [Clostridia bacterium]
MKKKFAVSFLTIVFLFSSLSWALAIPTQQRPDDGEVAPPAHGQTEKNQVKTGGLGLETSAESAVLMDAASGKILYDKNMNKSLPPASVTKIMTLLMALEAIDQGKVKLTDKVETSENAWKMGGSQIYLEPGEQMSMKDMLLAIAVGSANDASVAVAEHIGGSHEEFVAMMNDKVKKLGLKNTRFVNANGLTAEGHVTSAYDMAVILKEAMKYPLFLELTSIKHHELRGGEFKLDNRNKLLWWYRGTLTGKTGWTNDAKYCLASAVERDGLRLITVVLGVPEIRGHYKESMRVYNWGFAKYRGVTFANAGDKVRILPVGKGLVDKVEVIAGDRAAVTVLKGEDKKVAHRIELPEMVQAPVKKGQKIGEMILTIEGKEVGRVALVAKHPVEKASVFTQIYRTFEEVFNFGK